MPFARSPVQLTRPWALVAGMVTLVHVTFLLGAWLRNSTAALSCSPIRRWADAFLWFWFLVVPLLLELLVVGWPLTRLGRRLAPGPSRPGARFALFGVFALYFLVDAGLYGAEVAAYKTGLLDVLFGLLLTWGYLAGETDEGVSPPIDY